MRLAFELNQWESDFFARPIWRTRCHTDDSQFADEIPYGLLQIKVPTNALNEITFLQQQGFHLVEGEIDFCLDIAKLKPSNVAYQIATEQDITALESLFSCAFLQSRFRSPYFSEQENQRFYRTWIAKAVRGEFDDVCLVWRDEQGDIVGGISLRLVENTVRVGLLAVSPNQRGQGIGRKLLESAIDWALQKNCQQFYVATQISNLSAIRLYESIGAKVCATHYWFYR